MMMIRMIKMWTKLNDPNVIVNLQFYMQHELQKFELTLDQLRSEEAMTNFQFLLNKCVEKFVPTKICKGAKNKKLWIDYEIKHLATKKRQQYHNFMRTKDKNDQLKFNALRNKKNLSLQKFVKVQKIKNCGLITK